VVSGPNPEETPERPTAQEESRNEDPSVLKRLAIATTLFMVVHGDDANARVDVGRWWW
jgi:hypothetical protein